MNTVKTSKQGTLQDRGIRPLFAGVRYSEVKRKKMKVHRCLN